MTDYFDDFMRTGRAVSASLRLRPGALEEASAIVRCAVGDDWIRDSVRRYRRLAPSLATAEQLHRIAECFSATGVSQVVEVLELAAYLEFAADIRGSDSAIKQIKSDYDHAFLQLAIAYRFGKVGLTIDRFEPQASAGRLGDILCAEGSLRSIVECYCPQVPTTNREYELWRLGKDLESFGSTPVRIDIRAKRRISAADRKRLQTFIHTIHPLTQGPWELDDLSAHVSVERIAAIAGADAEDALPTLCADASWIMRVSTADESAVKNLAISSDFQREDLSYMRVWMSAEAQAEFDRDPYANLAERLSRKLTQVRTGDAFARLVVARVYGVEDRDERVQRMAESIRNELSRKHARWNGAFLVNRRWMPYGRYMLFGVYIIGSERPIMEESRFRQLVTWEESADILADLGA